MPRIGLLSDSHGRAETTARAVAVLIEHGVDMLIHLGDVGGTRVIDELLTVNAAGDPVPARLVFGNCDWDAADLDPYARSLGVSVDAPVGELDLPAGRLIYQHGHLDNQMRFALASEPAWLCHGHTHEVRDERVGPTRVINPGALFRAARYTVAVLETESDRLTVLDVPRQ